MHPTHPPIIPIGSWAELATAAIALVALIGALFALRYTATTARTSAAANEITAATYARDTKERREAQARFVYTSTVATPMTIGEHYALAGGFRRSVVEAGVLGSDFGTLLIAPAFRVQIEVINESRELVGPIVLGAYNRKTGEDYGAVVLSSDRPILPGKAAHYEIVVRARPGEHDPGAVLSFRDSSGQWWTRRGYDPIDPVKFGLTGDVTVVRR